MSLEEQFRPLVDLKRADRQDFSNAVLNMCNYPADIDTVLITVSNDCTKEPRPFFFFKKCFFSVQRVAKTMAKNLKKSQKLKEK